MADAATSKKRYFKKEKKQLKPKRHKAKSQAELEAAGKKGLRRGSPGEEKLSISSDNPLHFPKLQFPNIPRFITESLENVGIGSFFKLKTLENFSKKQIRRAKKKNFWLSIVLLGACLFACFLGWKLWDMYTNFRSMQQNYAKVQHNLVVWEHVTKQYPTYRDAYFEAAILAYRLGEKTKEIGYLQKTLSIDPNFAPALELKKISQ